MNRTLSLLAALSLCTAVSAMAQTTDTQTTDTQTTETEAATAPAADGFPLPITARGNEPFWSVEATPDALRLSQPEGKGTVQDLPFTQETDGGSLILTTTDFTLRIDPVPCRDDMSGMPYPYTATLTRASSPLNGCAGEPGQVLGGDWIATALNGSAIPADMEVTLSFLDGRIIGKSGCNSYIGSYSLTGEGLTIGDVGATRMACPPAQMETEQAVFTAFAAVARFDISGDGGLLLQSDDGTTVLAARR